MSVTCGQQKKYNKQVFLDVRFFLDNCVTGEKMIEDQLFNKCIEKSMLQEQKSGLEPLMTHNTPIHLIQLQKISFFSQYRMGKREIKDVGTDIEAMNAEIASVNDIQKKNEMQRKKKKDAKKKKIHENLILSKIDWDQFPQNN